MATALALGAGPLHSHRATRTDSQAWIYTSADVHTHTHTHKHAHETGERHHHAVGDLSVAADRAAQEATEAAAQALSAALALLALQTPRCATDRRQHVQVAAADFFWRSAAPHRLYRPPSPV
jgi:hypothetical protein